MSQKTASLVDRLDRLINELLDIRTELVQKLPASARDTKVLVSQKELQPKPVARVLPPVPVPTVPNVKVPEEARERVLKQGRAAGAFK